MAVARKDDDLLSSDDETPQKGPGPGIGMRAGAQERKAQIAKLQERLTRVKASNQSHTRQRGAQGARSGGGGSSKAYGGLVPSTKAMLAERQAARSAATVVAPGGLGGGSSQGSSPSESPSAPGPTRAGRGKPAAGKWRRSRPAGYQDEEDGWSSDGDLRTAPPALRHAAAAQAQRAEPAPGARTKSGQTKPASRRPIKSPARKPQHRYDIDSEDEGEEGSGGSESDASPPTSAGRPSPGAAPATGPTTPRIPSYMLDETDDEPSPLPRHGGRAAWGEAPAHAPAASVLSRGGEWERHLEDAVHRAVSRAVASVEGAVGKLGGVARELSAVQTRMQHEGEDLRAAITDALEVGKELGATQRRMQRQQQTLVAACEDQAAAVSGVKHALDRLTRLEAAQAATAKELTAALGGAQRAADLRAGSERLRLRQGGSSASAAPLPTPTPSASAAAPSEGIDFTEDLPEGPDASPVPLGGRGAPLRPVTPESAFRAPVPRAPPSGRPSPAPSDQASTTPGLARGGGGGTAASSRASTPGWGGSGGRGILKPPPAARHELLFDDRPSLGAGGGAGGAHLADAAVRARGGYGDDALLVPDLPHTRETVEERVDSMLAAARARARAAEASSAPASPAALGGGGARAAGGGGGGGGGGAVTAGQVRSRIADISAKYGGGGGGGGGGDVRRASPAKAKVPSASAGTTPHRRGGGGGGGASLIEQLREEKARLLQELEADRHAERRIMSGLPGGVGGDWHR